jgi:hypothetical protein
MALRLNKSHFIRTPFGGFKRESVKSVTSTDTGVAVFDDSNQMIFWVEENNMQKAQDISHALMEAVIEGTQIDWDSFNDKPKLEHKTEQTSE